MFCLKRYKRKDISMAELLNFVLYLAFLTFLDSSVTDESFVDETRVWRIYKI